MVKENKKNKEATQEQAPRKPRVESQTFGGIGLFEVVNGDIVLRGRHGHRDHLFPLHRAVEKYEWAMDMAMNMMRTGLKGWDTMIDFSKDLEAKICEAVDQRRSMNLDTCKEALDFYAKHYVQH